MGAGDAAGGGWGALVRKAAAWAHLGGGGGGGSRHCQVLGARCGGGGEGKRSLDGFNSEEIQHSQMAKLLLKKKKTDGKTFWSF